MSSLAEAGLPEAGPAEAGLAGAGPAKAGLAGVGLAEAGSAEAGLTETEPTEAVLLVALLATLAGVADTCCGFHPAQTQSIGHHAYRAHAHSSCCDHRVQAEARPSKRARRHRNADGVVEQCPEQVLLDVAHSGTRKIQGSGHIGQITVHQHDIGT